MKLIHDLTDIQNWLLSPGNRNIRDIIRKLEGMKKELLANQKAWDAYCEAKERELGKTI